MIWKVETTRGCYIAEAPDKQKALFAVAGRWGKKMFDIVAEIPADQCLLMQEYPLLPGVDWLSWFGDSPAWDELDWRNRSVYEETRKAFREAGF